MCREIGYTPIYGKANKYGKTLTCGFSSDRIGNNIWSLNVQEIKYVMLRDKHIKFTEALFDPSDCTIF